MKSIISHTAVAIVGLTIGIAYHGLGKNTHAEVIEDSEVNNSSVQQSASRETLTPSGSVAQESNAIEVSDDLAITGSNDESKSDQIDEYSTTPLSIADLLTNMSSEMIETGQIDLISASFANWFDSSENPGKDIIDYLLSDEVDDDKKHVMEYLIASNSAMQTIDGLDLSLVRQLAIATTDSSEEWENILNIVSISSSEARTELLTALPNVTSDKLVSNSLLAIKPDFVSPTERSQLLNDISVYTESDSEEVRSAAIMSLGQWSAQGYSYIVEDMLTNGTIEQKNAAIISASSGNIWSEQIANQTLATLNDANMPDDIRKNAFFALSNHPLDDYEYEQVHKYYAKHILPLRN